MSFYVVVLHFSAAISVATSLRLGGSKTDTAWANESDSTGGTRRRAARRKTEEQHEGQHGVTSYHQTDRDTCISNLQSCWQKPIKIHDALEKLGLDCSMKFGIEQSANGGHGVPLKLTVEPIGPDCLYGDYLKAYVVGPEHVSFSADLSISKAAKLAEAELSLPFPGSYNVTIFHHYINGTGKADINMAKSFSLAKLECGFDITPACADSSEIAERRRQRIRPCDVQHDDPTEGYWQRKTKYGKDGSTTFSRFWQPWDCEVPRTTADDIVKQPVFQIAIVGSSRPRTYYYDMINLLNYTFEGTDCAHCEPKKKVQQDMDRGRPAPFFPDVNFMWGECKDDLDPGPDSGVLKSSDAYEKHFSAFAANHQLCESESMASVVVFSIGICEVARSTFDSIKPYVQNVLRHVARTCSKGRVIVVPEMAAHQAYHTQLGHDLTAQAMSNERIIMVNDVMRAEAKELGLEFLDAYKMTSSYYPSDSWDPLVHYFKPGGGSYAGGAASREFTKMLLASIFRVQS